MNRSPSHHFQRSFRTHVFPMRGARDEDIVTITEDDGTTNGGGEGEVTGLDSAVFKYTHDCGRCCGLPPPFSS